MNKTKKIILGSIISLIVIVFIGGIFYSIKLIKRPTQNIKETEEKQTTVRIDISNWKTYRSEDFGFEIKYPPDYVFQQRTTAGSAIPIKFSGEFISQKDLNKKEEPRECEIPGIFIEIYDREDFGINENQTLEEFIMERCKKEQIGKENICEKLKIGDYEWIKAEWPDMCPEENYYLEKNNLVYQFRSMTYEIEPILSTFKIFNIPLIKKQTPLCWAKTYGSEKVMDVKAHSIIQTSDGGYVLGGEIHRTPLVMKLDSFGNIQWVNACGFEVIYGSGEERVNSIVQTLEGGYILTEMMSPGPFVTKLDSSGNIQWAKEYEDIIFHSIIQTSDGGYILGGEDTNYEEILVIKLDSSGNIQWAKAYGGNKKFVNGSIIKTSEGGYILVGITNSFGDEMKGRVDELKSRVLVIKTDSSGNIQWAKTYEGEYYETGPISILQVSDGGYILSGSVFLSNENIDGLVIKLDSAGNIQWAKAYRGNKYDAIVSIIETSDEGYVLAGSTNSFGVGERDFFLMKLTPSGNISWAKTYGGNSYDDAYSVSQTLDGGYILGGYTASFRSGNYSNILVIKTDPNGNISFSRNGPVMENVNPKINLLNFETKDVKNKIKTKNISTSSISVFDFTSDLTPGSQEIRKILLQNLSVKSYSNSCK